MKKKILSKILMAVMAASILLTGCGKQQTGNFEESMSVSEAVQEQDKNKEHNFVFSGTIFDNLVVMETSTTDVVDVLNERVLEYQYENVDNSVDCLVGKTTITDDFHGWDALYRYVLCGSAEDEEQDYVLTDWIVELLLDEDAEYREAVKYIQSTIDENMLTEYTPIEDSYSDDMVQGDVVYYPIQKFKVNGVDCLKYIMFGKYANCDKEEAKHIVILSVGIIAEESYLNGEIIIVPTVSLNIDVDSLGILPENLEGKNIEEKTIEEEKAEHQNIAFFITDHPSSKNNNFGRNTFIISMDKNANKMKLVSIPRKLYFNIGEDRYSTYSRVSDDPVQAIKTINTNLDMNVVDFISIDSKSLSEFVDVLGGVWIDVPEIEEKGAYTQNVMSLLGTDESITLNEGYQLLNGNQLVLYSWYMGTYSESEGELQIIMAINEQMQKVDKETLEQAVNVYTSKVYSSIDVEIIRDGMKNISDYRYVGEASFPQENMRQEVSIGSDLNSIVPVDLEANVIWLHQFLFEQNDYEASSTVKEYSSMIKAKAAQ